MPSEGTSGGEFAESVTDHIFGDIYRNVLSAVVDSDGVTDEIGEDRRSTGPGAKHLLAASGIQFLNSLKEFGGYERPFLNASAQLSITSAYLPLRLLTMNLSVRFFFLRVL